MNRKPDGLLPLTMVKFSICHGLEGVITILTRQNIYDTMTIIVIITIIIVYCDVGVSTIIIPHSPYLE